MDNKKRETGVNGARGVPLEQQTGNRSGKHQQEL